MLMSRGERQATALRHILNGRRFALILRSPMRRGSDTCRLAGYDATVKSTDLLLEWDYGIYVGRMLDDIR